MSASGGQIVIDLVMDGGQFKVSVKDATTTLGGFKKTLDSAASSVKKLEEHQTSITRKFRDLVLTLGSLRFVAMDINDIFLKLPMSILKTAGELEQLTALVTGLSKEFTKAGRQAEGLRSFDFITNLAKTAPFNIKAIADSFVKFKSAGLDPTNGSLQALIDGVAKFGGSGEVLKRASVAIQQMSGKGVVSMEELRQQLGEAVPTAMQDMADQMGVSMADLAKMVQTGTLKAGPAIAKMLLRMQVNNAGAAKEMMNTWVGMTSQLATQWDLTAKKIADSGFAVEAKRVLEELQAALSSKDGQAAAVSFGQSLASITTGLVSLGKFLWEHAETIKLAAQAWIAYKVVTGIIAPMSASIVAGFASQKIAINNQVNSVTNAAAVQRQASIAFATSMRDDALAAQQRSARVIEAKAVEMVQLDRMNAEILAKQARLNAVLATARSPAADVQVPFGTGVPGLAGIQSQKAVKDSYEALTQQMRNSGQASQQLMTEMSALQARHRALTSDVTTTTSSLGSLAASSGIAKSAISSAAAVIGGTFRFALMAVGGWVGVAILAVSALIGWFYKLKGAADEAAAAVSRGKQDRSTKDDAKNDADAEESALARLSGLRAMRDRLDKQSANTRGQLSNVELIQQKTNNKDLITAEADYAEKRDRAAVSRKSVRRQAIAADASDMVAEAKTSIDSIKSSEDTRLAVMQEANTKRLGKLKEGTDAWKAVRLTASKEEATLAASIRGEESKRTLVEADKLSKKIGLLQSQGKPADNQDLLAAQAAHATLMGNYKQEQREIETMIASRDAKIEGGTKDKDKDKDKGKGKSEKLLSPLQKMLIEIKADNVGLQVEVDAFFANFGKIDKAVAASAAIREKGRLGGFNTGTKKAPIIADPKMVEELATLTEGQIRRKEALKAAGQIRDTAAGMESEFLRAVQMMTDPLSLLPDRGKAGDFDDALKKSGLTIEQIGAAAGKSGDDLERFVAEMARLRKEAATIDMAKRFVEVTEANRDMADETVRINIELVKDERSRVEQLDALEIGLYKRKKERLLQSLRDSRSSGTLEQNEQAEIQIALYEKSLPKILAAKEAMAADKSKPAMDKMLDNWRDATKQMEEATASWAQSSVDAFVNFARTGKLEWKSLVSDILSGILKIQMQKQLADMAGTSGSSGWGAFAKAAAGMLGGYSGSSGSSGSSGGIGSATATDVGNAGGTLTFLADGGIMSNLGSMPLRKYAAGGIATSPQLAVFGEAGMNEAFVPLPDGRSIPVTMKGGGSAGPAAAPNVTVNVINQTSAAVNSKQSNTRFDGQQMILDVVLTAANTPGPFRDSMQGAFK